MKKTILTFLKMALLCCAVYEVSLFCVKKTDGFTLASVTSELSYNPAWDINESLEETHFIKNILSQKFHYLASGGQAFVFASEDGKYVVKFFKNYLLPSWLNLLPLPHFLEKSLTKQYTRRHSKLQRDFSSYKIAFEELKEETGLIYLHLNKTDSLKQKLTIVDKIGIAHVLDLDSYEFVLQRRAELIYPYIQTLMKKGETALAKDALIQLLKVVAARSKKGVYDEDARFHRNFGFIDGKGMVIDIGRFKRNENYKSCQLYKDDLYLNTRKLSLWLENSYPELALFLDGSLKEASNE